MFRTAQSNPSLPIFSHPKLLPGALWTVFSRDLEFEFAALPLRLYHSARDAADGELMARWTAIMGNWCVYTLVG